MQASSTASYNSLFEKLALVFCISYSYVAFVHVHAHAQRLIQLKCYKNTVLLAVYMPYRHATTIYVSRSYTYIYILCYIANSYSYAIIKLLYSYSYNIASLYSFATIMHATVLDSVYKESGTTMALISSANYVAT